MKYYAHYKPDLDAIHNIITHICKAEDYSVVNENEYEVSEETYKYLYNQINVGVLKSDTSVTKENCVNVSIEGAVHILDHTIYLVGYIKNVLPSKGELVNIINCIRVVDENDYFDEKLFMVSNEEVYNFLNTSINLAKMAFSKIYFDSDVTDLNSTSLIKLTPDDITSEFSGGNVEDTEVELYKKYILFEGKNLLLGRTDALTGFHFYHFITLNNKLVSEGYYITEENRQDKYIEIVGKSDPKILDILSKYLDVMDLLNIPYYFYSKYIEFKEEVDNADTMDECKSAFEAYSSLFK